MSVDSIDVRLARLEGGFDQISQRLALIESRIAAIENRFDAVEARLGARIDGLDAKIERVRAELLARMDRQFYWLLGLLVSSILLQIWLRVLPP